MRVYGAALDHRGSHDRYAHLGARPQRPGGTLRVTLAHDYLLVMRGAERTFAAIADLYPQAPICTLLYDERATDGRFANAFAHLGKGGTFASAIVSKSAMVAVLPYRVMGAGANPASAPA